MPQPVRWGEGRQQQAVDWLYDEIQQALRERDPLERKWRRWLDLYRAPAQQPLKRFPFEGAHNYMLPAIATDVDQMVAAFLQTLHAPANIWSCSALNERWVDVAKPMQDFLEAVDLRLLKMWDVNYRAVMEMTKLGTGIYKTGWVYEKRPIQTYDNAGKRVKTDLLRTQPFVDHVRLADFLLPTYSYAIQPDQQGGAPWVAERMRLSPWAFQAMAKSAGDFLPQFDPAGVQTVLQYLERSQTDYQNKVEQQQYNSGTSPVGTFNQWDRASVPEAMPNNGGSARVREIELWEVHVRCETEPDQLNDLILWFHWPSRTVLRAIYADWLSGERPYDVIRYMRTEGFYAMGVAEQKEMFQEATSTILNFGLDNMVLGNSTMLGAKGGANIAPGEPIYPGKILITDGSPKDELFPMTLGTPGNSAAIMQAFQIFQGLGERRTGVSDIQLGQMQDLPGRTPATTMLSLLQEGKRRPDLTIKDLRYQGLSNVGLKVLQVLQQQIAQPASDANGLWLGWAVDLLGLPEGKAVADKLKTPAENVAFGLGVTLTATSSTSNKEVEKQSLTALMQLAGSVAQQLIQFQQLALTMPPLAPTCIAANNGLLELFTRLLEQYDVRNIDEIIPTTALPAPQPPAVPGVGGPPPGPDNGTGGGAQAAGGGTGLEALAGRNGTPVGAGGGAFPPR